MLEGYYFDPKHGGCLRKIVKIDNCTFKITGAYGDDEPQTGEKWNAIAKKIKKDLYLVNFGGKKHVIHGDYKAKWNKSKRVLEWEDGNYWKLMFDWYKK